MNWPKLIVFVRHAESEGNIVSSDEKACLENPNFLFSLTKQGEKQAVITGDYLRKHFGDFDAKFSSYYKRTKQTIEIMYPEARFIEDARLAERQSGIWHSMIEAQAAERFPEESIRKKREGYYHYRPFGGENWPDVELRIHSFLDMLRRDYSGKRVLCVTHGHWLVLLQKILHNFSIEKALEDYSKGTFENASVTFYERDEKNPNKILLRETNIVPWKK